MYLYLWRSGSKGVYLHFRRSRSFTVSLISLVYHLYLGMPDRNQRITLWDRFSQEFEMETPLNTEVICAKYKLSVGQIRLAVKYLRQKELSGICVEKNR